MPSKGFPLFYILMNYWVDVKFYVLNIINK